MMQIFSCFFFLFFKQFFIFFRSFIYQVETKKFLAFFIFFLFRFFFFLPIIFLSFINFVFFLFLLSFLFSFSPAFSSSFPSLWLISLLHIPLFTLFAPPSLIRYFLTFIIRVSFKFLNIFHPFLHSIFFSSFPSSLFLRFLYFF